MPGWGPAHSVAPSGWGTTHNDAWHNWKSKSPNTKTPGHADIFPKRTSTAFLEERLSKRHTIGEGALLYLLTTDIINFIDICLVIL